jgi:signal transduction histidine kinase
VTTPLAQWLKPPRSLLLILFLLTLVSVSALGWFGWSLLDQDRMVETQRVRERLERAADSVAAALRGTLADIGDRLSTASVQTPPVDGLLLILDERGITAAPAERLLYRPFVTARADANGDLFEEGERLEFQEARPGSAAEIYRGLAGSKDAAVRAGGLLRLARVSRADAAGAYRQLAAVAGANVAGAPADLVARHALCELTGRRDEAEALQRDLLAARWPLTKGQFEFYWREVTRMAGREEPPPMEAAAFSDAAALVWQDRDAGPRGTRTVWVDGRPLFFLWRAAGGRKAVLVAEPPAVLKQACANEDVLCAVADNDGRMLAGRRAGAGHAVVRTAAESQLPWTLYVAEGPAHQAAGVVARQRFLLLGTTVMVVFLIAGTYFIARAIRREAEVARVQSEFVSTVSHEFRSPLTSLRQLSEILVLGRVPNEARRQVYYETLVRETARLQRLVEALLNFGRMEAGARQYRFEEMDAAELVRRVAAEFAEQLAGS